MTVRINKIPVRLQLDTGSDITLFSEGTWERSGKPQVKPTKHWTRNAAKLTVSLTPMARRRKPPATSRHAINSISLG